MMRKNLSPVLAAIATLTLAASGAYAACANTGFYQDGHELTAAVVNPPGTVTGPLDATGCDIGVYYGPGASGAVDSATISGATYYGVLVAGDCGGATCTPGATAVDVTNSTVSEIGDNPLSGSQHGDAITYYAFAPGASATGTVSGNYVSQYQKNGISVKGPGAAATISGNTVKGEGPTNRIAQNGIEIAFGATGQVTRNTVTGNAYTGANDASSAGILIFGGCQDFFENSLLTTGVQIVKNIVGDSTSGDGNDIGVALANYNPTCTTVPTTATNNKAINNAITNGQITNVSGNGSPDGYQAGVLDSGVNDKIINNDISGKGYATPAPCALVSGGTETCSIDTDSSTATKVHANSLNP
jgi:hypothetical protein